jgi:hypothetical protein
MAIFYGAGIPRGQEMREYNNLDFAPTFLEILGLPRDPGMHGRVMEEVMEEIVPAGKEPSLAQGSLASRP